MFESQGKPPILLYILPLCRAELLWDGDGGWMVGLRPQAKNGHSSPEAVDEVGSQTGGIKGVIRRRIIRRCQLGPFER